MQARSFSNWPQQQPRQQCLLQQTPRHLVQSIQAQALASPQLLEVANVHEGSSLVDSTSPAAASLAQQWQGEILSSQQPRLAATYGGSCTRCGGWHELRPSQEAIHAACQLIQQLEQHGRFDFELPDGDPGINPGFSTDYVWTKGPGRMLGVLLAQDPHTGRAVTLKAFSGQLTERWEVPGWVGPVARITSASPQYKQQREKIEGISAQMQQIEQKQQLQQTAAPGVVVQSGTSTASQGQPGAPGTALTTTGQGLQGDKELQRQRRLLRQQQRDPRRSWHPDARAEYERLVAERRQLSHELIRNVQASYESSDVLGRPLQLYDVYWQHTQQALLAPSQPRANASDQQQSSREEEEEGSAGEPSQQVEHTTPQAAAKTCSPGPSLPPAGIGDCCAPKLLHAAAQQGLTPLSLVEFWYGSPPSTNTPQGVAAAARRKEQQQRAGRGAKQKQKAAAHHESRVHCAVYGACPKCRAILGTMLCITT